MNDDDTSIFSEHRCSAVCITFVNFVTCPVRQVVLIDQIICEDVKDIHDCDDCCKQSE